MTSELRPSSDRISLRRAGAWERSYALKRWRIRHAGLVWGLLLLALAHRLPADTFVVTKTEDDNGACTPDDCSVREAVIASVTTPGDDRIEIPSGIHVLTITGHVCENASMTGDLDVFYATTNFDVTEFVGDSEGRTVIVGAAENRVIETQGGVVRFSNIEITGGVMGFNYSLGSDGGCALIQSGEAIFIDSSISHCFSESNGGGLAAFGSSVTLINSTVHGNESETRGGGIYHSGFERDRRLTIINSTISGNKAPLGGGLYKFGDGETSISYTTIADNEAAYGTALFNDFPTRRTRVRNSIFEGTCRGLLPSSDGGNLAGPDLTDHCLLGSHVEEVLAEDLGLGPLAYNGGPTLTHGLLAGSPALDAAIGTDCPSTDQRHHPRPDGAGCDIGAVEGVVPVPDIPVLGGRGVLVFVLLLAGAAVLVLGRR